MIREEKRNEVMKTKALEEIEQEELIEMIQGLEERMRKKNEDLTRTRLRLRKAKDQNQKLKKIVAYLRERVVKLHQ